jgi:hypothetical protein
MLSNRRYRGKYEISFGKQKLDASHFLGKLHKHQKFKGAYKIIKKLNKKKIFTDL